LFLAILMVAALGSGYLAVSSGRQTTIVTSQSSASSSTAATPSLTNASTTSSSSATATSTFATLPEAYTVNGLTCHFWQGTPSNVTSLVQNLTRDTRFLNATEKGQFMLGNFEKVGPGIQVIGGNRTVAGITIHTPITLELVFYSSLSGPTTCQQLPAEPRAVVVVHVPIQGGGFNVTGADFDCGPPGPGCPSKIWISTVTSGGTPNIGYHITLWENGTQMGQIGTCFSYCFFFVTNGQTYQVGAGSNGSETFSHWQNDGSTGLETVSVPASNNQSYAIQLTAIYSP
jgi:hypothetical protein